MTDPFRARIRVRYAECDPQGIAFNARWGDWLDLATTELLRAVLGTPSSIDYRLVDQHTTWLRPAHFDDVVELVPRVERVGRTSFEVHTSCSVNGREHVRAVTTYVRVVDGEK
ncbi:MAG: acyl-CoA thioesterase, partial [Myxococcales bacterium]|nr:acyl-CoA thioesterase [Myxococcales bacterium]